MTIESVEAPSQNFSALAQTLQDYYSSNEKYVTSQAAAALMKGLCAENGENNKIPSINIDRLFNESARNLVNEILEYRAELKERDHIEESSVSSPVSSGSTNAQRLQEMREELARTKQLLEETQAEQASIELQIMETNAAHDQALEELAHIPSEASSTATVDRNDSTTDKSSESLRESEEDLSALLSGLHSLFGVKINAIEWANEADCTGVCLSVQIGNAEYVFELDQSNKLIDIQTKRYPTGSNSIDTIKLLCECAQLEAPQDMRHAVFVLSAFSECPEKIKQDLRDIRKKCLVTVDPKDSRRIEVTFANGVSTILRVHECYPQVPNGVHIESACGVGGWTQRELDIVRTVVNGKCLKTIPDAIQSLLESLS